MKEFEKNMKEFDKALREELIKDGYITSEEKIKNIHWNDNGDIEINGEKVREEHKKKYDILREKYLHHVPGDNFHFVE
jgi:hypothetical protein